MNNLEQIAEELIEQLEDDCLYGYDSAIKDDRNYTLSVKE